MRSKRKIRFKKLRRKKIRDTLVMTLVMPALMILLGYLVATVIILPSM